MVRDGRQSPFTIVGPEGIAAEAAERLRESDMLKSLRKQNVALDHLLRALDGEDELDETASILRERSPEAGLAF